MARLSERLSAVFVAKVTAPGRYPDGHGLYLQVGKTGAKSWIFRFRDGARRPELGLGPLRVVSLKEAREKALALRKARLDGADLVAERRKVRELKTSAPTFRWCAEQYIRAHQAGWKGSGNAAQWTAALTAYVFPIIGARPVQAIDTGAVMRCLDPVWRDKPETASRVRQRIESILDWSAARGYRSGSNAAQWRGHLENLLPSPRKVRPRGHHTALPIDAVPAFLDALRGRQAVSARAIEFLLLSATRMSEVTGARWEEINFGERVWTVPGARMKGGVEHRVPLSSPALAVLAHMAQVRQRDFVFPGRKPGEPLKGSAMRDLVVHMGWNDRTTVHGLRSTFRDWAAERTSFAPELAEAALAHRIGNATERAYRRGDSLTKRRRLMEAWGVFCCTPAVRTGEVVSIGGRR